MVDGIRYEGDDGNLSFALLASEQIRGNPEWDRILSGVGDAISEMFNYLDEAGLQEVYQIEFRADPKGPAIYTAVRHYQMIRPQPERERTNG